MAIREHTDVSERKHGADDTERIALICTAFKAQVPATANGIYRLDLSTLAPGPISGLVQTFTVDAKLLFRGTAGIIDTRLVRFRGTYHLVTQAVRFKHVTDPVSLTSKPPPPVPEASATL